MIDRSSSIFKSLSAFAALAVGALPLSGCGIPEVAPLLGKEEKADLFAAVIRGVQCEIRNAVLQQVRQDRDGKLDWLLDWSALINMKLSFKNLAQFNPGAALNTPIIPANPVFGGGATLPGPILQSYSLGLGGNFSGSVARTESVEFYYDFSEFKKSPYRGDEVCYRHGGLTIKGDLDLKSWLADAIEPIKQCAFAGRPEEPGEFDGLSSEEAMQKRRARCHKARNPITTLAHQIDFEIDLSGGITPVWTLVRVTSPLPGTTNPLFGVSRTDMSELILTLGPGNEKPKDFDSSAKFGRRPQRRDAGPSEAMVYRNLSLQIGSAVRDAIK